MAPRHWWYERFPSGGGHRRRQSGFLAPPRANVELPRYSIRWAPADMHLMGPRSEQRAEAARCPEPGGSEIGFRASYRRRAANPVVSPPRAARADGVRGRRPLESALDLTVCGRNEREPTGRGAVREPGRGNPRTAQDELALPESNRASGAQIRRCPRQRISGRQRDSPPIGRHCSEGMSNPKGVPVAAGGRRRGHPGEPQDALIDVATDPVAHAVPLQGADELSLAGCGGPAGRG